MGRKVVSITDHDNVFAHPMMQSVCTKNNIKHILGCEMRIVDDLNNNQRTKGHLTVLAKTYEGYVNLMKLVTMSWTDGCFYYHPTIDKRMLFEAKDGLIVLSGCPSGLLSRAILDNDMKRASDLVKEFKDNLGDNYYLEVMAHDMDEMDVIVPAIRALSKKFDIRCVLTNDEHYLEKGQEKLQKILWCIRDREKFATHKMNPLPTLYYMTDDEMLEQVKTNIGKYFTKSEISELFNNQERIAADCNVTIPKAEFLKYGVDDPYKELRSQALEGLSIRGLAENREYTDRIEKELDLIGRKNFSNYFLVVSDIVNWAKDNEILVGPSRGSVACSLLAYAVGITEVDPIKFELPMERFMSEDRIDLPDIDMDFQDNRRQDVIEYMRNRFKSANVAQLATVVKFKGRNTLGELGKVFDIPNDDIKAVQGVLITRSSADARASFTIEDTFNTFPVAQRLAEKYPDILLSKYFENQIRHTSVHAAGIVVSDHPLWESTAVMRRNGTNIAMLTGESYGLVGLLKMDILGLDYLSILKDLCKEVDMNHLSLYTLSLDDQEAIKIFNGNTLGVFQFNEASTYSVARQLGVESFNDIMLSTSLSRPGPLHCVAGNTMIFDCDKDDFVTIKSAFKNGIKRTLSLYPDGSIKPANVNRIFSTGERRTYKLKVGNRSIVASLEHRFFVDGEWKELRDLSINSNISVVNRDDNHKLESFNLDEMSLYGLIGTYDMEIDGTHNYIANGFITHNSGNTVMITEAKKNNQRKTWEIDLMNEITKDTYGYVVFQEQVIRIMHEVGGMEWKDVSAIRSAMSRSLGDEYFNTFRGKFIEGSGKLHGLSEEYANLIFDHTSTFGSWSFNKAHAAGYSIISYWTAYFKAHYPRVFYKVLCDHAKSTERLSDFLREYKERGFGEILPPKINKSQLGWTIDGNNLRAGLMTVLPEGSATVIYGLYPIKDMEDLQMRAPRRKVNSRIIGLIDQNEMFSDNDSLDPFGLYAFAERLSYIPNRTKIGDLGYSFDGRTVTIGGVLADQINLKSIEELKATQKMKGNWNQRFDEQYGDAWCIVKITDESGAVMNCHVKNKIYPQYKDMLWSKVVGDDVLLFTGYVPGSTNYMIVKDIQEWNDRKAQDAKCYKCTLIKNNFCPASGNPNAKIVLVGMCPGYDEVNQKKPFVGKAGQILNKILKDIGINRDEDVFITNSALCRPVDGNKNIDPDEFQLACCHDRLFGEIKQSPRKVVVTFGKVAYYALTGENTKSITQISGTKIALEGYILIPTIHPAAALHQENEVEYKRLIKESLELAMNEAGMNGDKINVNCSDEDLEKEIFGNNDNGG